VILADGLPFGLAGRATSGNRMQDTTTRLSTTSLTATASSLQATVAKVRSERPTPPRKVRNIGAVPRPRLTPLPADVRLLGVMMRLHTGGQCSECECSDPALECGLWSLLPPRRSFTVWPAGSTPAPCHATEPAVKVSAVLLGRDYRKCTAKPTSPATSVRVTETPASSSWREA